MCGEGCLGVFRNLKDQMDGPLHNTPLVDEDLQTLEL